MKTTEIKIDFKTVGVPSSELLRARAMRFSEEMLWTDKLVFFLLVLSGLVNVVVIIINFINHFSYDSDDRFYTAKAIVAIGEFILLFIFAAAYLIQRPFKNAHRFIQTFDHLRNALAINALRGLVEASEVTALKNTLVHSYRTIKKADPSTSTMVKWTLAGISTWILVAFLIPFSIIAMALKVASIGFVNDEAMSDWNSSEWILLFGFCNNFVVLFNQDGARMHGIFMYLCGYNKAYSGSEEMTVLMHDILHEWTSIGDSTYHRAPQGSCSRFWGKHSGTLYALQCHQTMTTFDLLQILRPDDASIASSPSASVSKESFQSSCSNPKLSSIQVTPRNSISSTVPDTTEPPADVTDPAVADPQISSIAQPASSSSSSSSYSPSLSSSIQQ